VQNNVKLQTSDAMIVAGRRDIRPKCGLWNCTSWPNVQVR